MKADPAPESGSEEIAALQAQLEEKDKEIEALKAGSGEGSSLEEKDKEIAALNEKIMELEQASSMGDSDAYLMQLENDLKDAKLQLLASQENFTEFKKEFDVAKEKADRMDELEERSSQMEEFLNEIQEERNQLFEKLQVSEQQVVALGALLGKNQGNSNLEAENQKLKDQVVSLQSQIKKRDEEIERQIATMATLRTEKVASKRLSKTLPRNALSTPTSSVIEDSSVEGSGDGAEDKAVDLPAVEENPNISVVDFDPAADVETFSSLNVKKMEASKTRISIQDRKTFKNPEAAIIANGGKILLVKDQDAAVGCVAFVKGKDSLELKYMAFVPGRPDEEALLTRFVHKACEFAKEQNIPEVLTLFNGKTEEAHSKWGHFGFKNAGVGPAPDFAIKMSRKIE